ncbi:MAG: hypothetical protein JRM99_05665 [Nitrososphaerota archaeon]|nr:hypothetical protein [Nitrososphaerota archaeon]
MKSFCVSHSRDVDGISSAAMVAAATGAGLLLSDYPVLIRDLRRVPKDAKRFVLCDMGVDAADPGPFLKALGAVASRSKVTYIDHHFISEDTEKRIRELGVEYVHDESECASMLTYSRFREDLPEGAWRVALLGAVTDGMDSSPMASRLMETTDRLHVLAEAGLLSNAVMANRGRPGFAYSVAGALSRMEEPHRVRGVEAAALRQLTSTKDLARLVRSRARKLGGFAYVVVPPAASGNAADLVPGEAGVEVGVSLVRAGDRYMVELRGTSRYGGHLGKAISHVAAQFGGSGGGHRLAAGGNIPAWRKEDFLQALSREV